MTCISIHIRLYSIHCWHYYCDCIAYIADTITVVVLLWMCFQLDAWTMTWLLWVCLLPNSVMQRKEVPIFFDSASSTNLPSLYIYRAENVLGRVPPMPCYISGSTHPTLPHNFGNRDWATAESSVGRGNGSRLCELNLWMWHYGQGQPSKVTLAEADS